MERVIVTQSMVGICYMQVCAVKDATDKEILSVCNLQNPSGTRNGWSKVIRTLEDTEYENCLPVQCQDYEDRLHFLIEC